MPNTNFVPNWTFERTLPSPFDSYSGKSAVMKDIASKYCNQPKKTGYSPFCYFAGSFFLYEFGKSTCWKSRGRTRSHWKPGKQFYNRRISKPYRVAACSGLQPYDWEIYSRKV